MAKKIGKSKENRKPSAQEKLRQYGASFDASYRPQRMRNASCNSLYIGADGMVLHDRFYCYEKGDILYLEIKWL